MDSRLKVRPLEDSDHFPCFFVQLSFDVSMHSTCYTKTVCFDDCTSATAFYDNFKKKSRFEYICMLISLMSLGISNCFQPS